MRYNAAVAAIPMPVRIAVLPVSNRGYPVPAFVAWFDGVPDFRVINTPFLADAMRRKLCWVCGQPLGRNVASVVGPMCAISRTISEPPSHRDCAIFSARACPFLSNPKMRRNENDLPDHVAAPGNGIQRNPMAAGVWIARGVTTFPTRDGRALFHLEDPEEVLWFAEGRTATRAEVQASIDSGYHLLEEEAAREGPDAVMALAEQTAFAQRYLPAA